MKRVTWIWMLVMALGLSAENVALLDQAAAASTDSKAPGARPHYEYGDHRQINARHNGNTGHENKLLRYDRANEVEAQRLRLMLLLMMSLGQYRTPAN